MLELPVDVTLGWKSLLRVYLFVRMNPYIKPACFLWTFCWTFQCSTRTGLSHICGICAVRERLNRIIFGKIEKKIICHTSEQLCMKVKKFIWKLWYKEEDNHLCAESKYCPPLGRYCLRHTYECTAVCDTWLARSLQKLFKPIMLPSVTSSQSVSFGRTLCYIAFEEKNVLFSGRGKICMDLFLALLLKQEIEKGGGIMGCFPKWLSCLVAVGPFPQGQTRS